MLRSDVRLDKCMLFANTRGEVWVQSRNRPLGQLRDALTTVGEGSAGVCSVNCYKFMRECQYFSNWVIINLSSIRVRGYRAYFTQVRNNSEAIFKFVKWKLAMEPWLQGCWIFSFNSIHWIFLIFWFKSELNELFPKRQLYGVLCKYLKLWVHWSTR